MNTMTKAQLDELEQVERQAKEEAKAKREAERSDEEWANMIIGPLPLTRTWLMQCTEEQRGLLRNFMWYVQRSTDDPDEGTEWTYDYFETLPKVEAKILLGLAVGYSIGTRPTRGYPLRSILGFYQEPLSKLWAIVPEECQVELRLYWRKQEEEARQEREYELECRRKKETRREYNRTRPSTLLEIIAGTICGIGTIAGVLIILLAFPLAFMHWGLTFMALFLGWLMMWIFGQFDSFKQDLECPKGWTIK